MTETNGQLRAFIERIETIEEEIGDWNVQKSDIYREAKAGGFDAKVMRAIVADRRKDPAKLAEFEAMYELYAKELGVAGARARVSAFTVPNSDNYTQTVESKAQKAIPAPKPKAEVLPPLANGKSPAPTAFAMLEVKR